MVHSISALHVHNGPSTPRHYWWSSKSSTPATPESSTTSSSSPVSPLQPQAPPTPDPVLEATAIPPDAPAVPLPSDPLPIEAIPTDPLVGLADTMATPVAHHLGDFAAAGITSWINPSGLYVWATELVHVASGTPWWLTVILTSVALRGVLTPLTIRGLQETEKLRPVQPRITTLQNAMVAASKKGDKLGAARIQVELKDVITNARANPMLAPAAGVLNMIVSFSAFFGVRRIADMTGSPFHHGGAFWFQDLSAPDPILAALSIPFMMWTARVCSS